MNLDESSSFLEVFRGFKRFHKGFGMRCRRRRLKSPSRRVCTMSSASRKSQPKKLLRCNSPGFHLVFTWFWHENAWPMSRLWPETLGSTCDGAQSPCGLGGPRLATSRRLYGQPLPRLQPFSTHQAGVLGMFSVKPCQTEASLADLAVEIP